MNYYQIFLKNGNEVFVQANYFYEFGSPRALLFFNKKGIKDEELVAYFKVEEIIGCTKIEKEDLDEILNFWKENDSHGERCNSQREG